MPQFDFYSFFDQISSLVFFGMFFYLFYIYYGVKNIGEVIKVRDKLILFLTKKNVKNSQVEEKILAKTFFSKIIKDFYKFFK